MLNPYVFAGVAGYPLDSYSSGLWFCGGIKRLLTTWTGALLRVRKTTGADTVTEQDIGFVAGGALDTAALAAFIGAETAVITKVYDQSGGANHFAQATAGQQPRIALAGAYDGFMRWDGVDDRLDSVNLSPSVPIISAGGRYSMRSLPVSPAVQDIITQNPFVVAGVNSWGFQNQGNSGQLEAYLATGTNYYNKGYTATASEVSDLMVFDRTAAVITFYRNGAGPVSPLHNTAGSTPTGNFTASTVVIGAYSSTQNISPMNGKWFAIWANGQTTNGVAITGAL
jgi:hypothetical protein